MNTNHKITMLPIVLGLWAIQSFLAYGIMFAYWQRRFPTIADDNYHEDMIISLVCGLVPCSLIVDLFWIASHGYYGFKLV
jgi:uncharacterized membrane protein YqhA